jgi:hypothetical protein
VIEVSAGVNTSEIEDQTPPKKAPRIRRPKIAADVSQTD